MKNKDIIVIASQAWDIEIGSNCKNIAEEFAKNNKVIYVNPPLDRITSIKQKSSGFVSKRLDLIKHPEKSIEKISENIWTIYTPIIIESINWLPKGLIYRWLNKINNQRIAIEVKKALSILNFKAEVIFNDSYMFGGLHLKELLKVETQIYYIRDNLISQAYFKKHGEILEPEMIKNSDIVVANSTYLQEYALKYNPNSYYVGQGCELEAYAHPEKIEIPNELLKINSPKIGYIGYITSLRLDIELLRSIANKRPNWNIVLVGPTDEKFKESGLAEISNIYFLGAVPTNEVPNYIKGMDVCINPQLINDLTIGNYPRKIDEYLALGKATVATKTKAMEAFEAYVHLAIGENEYLEALELALKEQDESVIQSRIDFANTHTWEESVGLIYEAVNKL